MAFLDVEGDGGLEAAVEDGLPDGVEQGVVLLNRGRFESGGEVGLAGGGAQEEDEQYDQNDRIHHILGGTGHQLGAIEAEKRGDDDGRDRGCPEAEAIDFAEDVCFTGNGETACTDDGADKEDVVEDDHDLAEAAIAEGGLDEGAVVRGAFAAGIFDHVEHDAAGDEHGQQRHDQADPAVFLIVLRTERAGGKAGPKMSAQPHGCDADIRCGENSFFLIHASSSLFLF